MGLLTLLALADLSSESLDIFGLLKIGGDWDASTWAEFVELFCSLQVYG